MEEVRQVKEFLIFGQPYWVGVLVDFVAIIVGVLIGFYLENVRRHREERYIFGRLIKGVFVESALNQAILGNISNLSTAGKIVPADVEMGALRTALTTHLTYKYAPWSLLKTMTIASGKLSEFKNILTIQRHGGSYGKAPTEINIEELKTHADICRKLIIDVLQPEIELLRRNFNVQLHRDDRSKEVDEKMNQILKSSNM